MWARSLSAAVAFGIVFAAVGLGALGAGSIFDELRPGAVPSPVDHDGGLGVFSGSTITVSLSITPTTLDVGQLIQVSTMANGGDPTPSYTYTYYGMPSGCMSDEQQAFSCSPSQTGPFDIYVNVTDGHDNYTNSATIDLSVDSALTASLTVSPSQVTSGTSISVNAMAGGGSGSYSYNYFGLPSGCQGQNGQSFTCTPSGTGDFTIYVNVSDTNGAYVNSNTQNLQVSSSGSNSGGSGSGSGSNNSSNPLGSLLSGFSGILSLLLIVGVIGFVTWILLIVGVWIIAIVLIRRLPKRGVITAAAAAAAATKCASCSAAVPAGSKFCPECGTSTAPKTP
jgi:hypothetical protein